MKHYIGIDLGGTNIAAGIVNEEYQVVAKASIPVNGRHSVDDIIMDMLKAAELAANKVQLTLKDFQALGVGMPSVVNPRTRLLMNSNNLGWRNLPIYDYLEKHTDMPVYLENDANCAVLGETLAGVAREHHNAIMLTLGTGVGGGIIMNRKIYAGADQMGAELGHTKLIYGGELCTCGQKGCLEAYCSATALIAQAKRKMESHKDSLLWKYCGGIIEMVNGKMVFDALSGGDAAAQEIAAQYVDYLTAGISSFVSVFRPEVVILGGGIAGAGEALLKPVNLRLKEVTYAAEEMGVPQVVGAMLGNDAGIIGAALLQPQETERK